MQVKPLQDRVLVQRLEAEEKTKSGLIIPDSAQEKPFEGRVLAVGNGRVLTTGALHKPDVKVGDKVLFSKYAGSEVRVDGKDVVVLREDEILGVVE